MPRVVVAPCSATEPPLRHIHTASEVGNEPASTSSRLIPASDDPTLRSERRPIWVAPSTVQIRRCPAYPSAPPPSSKPFQSPRTKYPPRYGFLTQHVQEQYLKQQVALGRLEPESLDDESVLSL